MRIAYALIAALALCGGAVSGCTNPTIIGTACKADSDCNVAGQVCAPGFNGGPSICTRKCTGQTGAMGCPIGYDCFPTDPAKGSTCNKALYEVDQKTGKPLLFGKDCSLDNTVCTSAGSKNANPVCRMIPDTSVDPPVPVQFDPNAYCSGSCTTDADCPLDFACRTDYDKAQRCLRRELCTPCTVDANCPTNFPVCIPTKDGKSHYCSKTCEYVGDCGGVQNTAFICDYTTNAAGGQVLACQHRFGACIGQGNICDPCYTDADCEKSGSQCLFNSATGERFCSKSCKADSECTSKAGTVMTACDNTDFYDPMTNPRGESIGICNGDVTHVTPGLFSCWPQP